MDNKSENVLHSCSRTASWPLQCQTKGYSKASELTPRLGLNLSCSLRAMMMQGLPSIQVSSCMGRERAHLEMLRLMLMHHSQIQLQTQHPASMGALSPWRQRSIVICCTWLKFFLWSSCTKKNKRYGGWENNDLSLPIPFSEFKSSGCWWRAVIST